jgi:hypothetical protein
MKRMVLPFLAGVLGAGPPSRRVGGGGVRRASVLQILNMGVNKNDGKISWHWISWLGVSIELKQRPLDHHVSKTAFCAAPRANIKAQTVI